MSRRDSATGELTHPVSINVRLAGEVLPRAYSAAGWHAAAEFLSSPEFLALADRVEYVTLNHAGAVS